MAFDAGDSRDDSVVVGYLWDFGDDAPTESVTTPTMTHSYAAAGSYRVLLRVTDDGGLTAETFRDITVTPAPGGDGPFTLTLTILGGPGAGQVVSSEFPIPNIDCVNSTTSETTCTASYASGAEVNLIPTPFGVGEITVVWTGCDIDIGIEGCTLNMNSNRTVTATFQ